MPRKPRENYHQINGRPHVGLEDPAKFGLTFNEVVDLINKGEWRTFYQNWKHRERKERRVRELDFICPYCSQVRPHFKDWRYNAECCNWCRPKDRKCSNCQGKRRVVFETGSFRLCASCKQLLDALEEIERISNEA